MPRNRQRARDRKLQQPLRANVPGELDHASGDAAEFEASIVAGAAGEPVGLPDEDADDRYAAGRRAARDDAAGGSGEPPVAADDDLDDDDEDEPTRSAAARRAGPRTGGNVVVNFLWACWAELQRVQWPDRRQVAQATAVVLGFVVIAGAYLGIADVVARQIVNAII